MKRKVQWLFLAYFYQKRRSLAEEVRRCVLDIFVDRVYIYKDKMIITFHFTDDRWELSYAETLEMIENHEYLMDCVIDPEAYVAGVRLVMFLFRFFRRCSSAGRAFA